MGDLAAPFSDAGAKAQARRQFLDVYDPEAGFVTGGGLVNSLVGAHAALTGEANLGFVAKYRKGASLPIGRQAIHEAWAQQEELVPMPAARKGSCTGRRGSGPVAQASPGHILDAGRCHSARAV